METITLTEQQLDLIRYIIGDYLDIKDALLKEDIVPDRHPTKWRLKKLKEQIQNLPF